MTTHRLSHDLGKISRRTKEKVLLGYSMKIEVVNFIERVLVSWEFTSLSLVLSRGRDKGEGSWTFSKPRKGYGVTKNEMERPSLVGYLEYKPSQWVSRSFGWFRGWYTGSLHQFYWLIMTKVFFWRRTNTTKDQDGSHYSQYMTPLLSKIEDLDWNLRGT